jgi:hypothetical protein
MSLLMDPTTPAYETLMTAVISVSASLGGLCVLNAVISFANTMFFNVQYPESDASTSDSNSRHKTKKLHEDRFRNCVIAAHITSLCANAIVCPVWYYYGGRLNNYTFSIFIYTCVASAIIVFLTEFRVRKNELTNALVSIPYILYRDCLY